MKKTFVWILGILVVAAIAVGIYFAVIKNNGAEIAAPVAENPPVAQPIGMCYSYAAPGKYGTDRAWLQMEITDGTEVIGEYRNLPAGIDSNVGTIAGTAGPMNPATSSRIANVIWDAHVEGTNEKRELKIEFGEGSAHVLFGELEERADGVYVYKKDATFTSGFQMSQTDCETLMDRVIVERYVRDNIAMIVTEKPVLGGMWYATAVTVDPATKSGTVSYEDGHVQGKVTFSYIRNGDAVTITKL
ncbi:MAG: hypothetical protein JWM20_69 [Patescibacteria group bacterium]|nr:hypothetical protein [Patescibacteria group bacterium]